MEIHCPLMDTEHSIPIHLTKGAPLTPGILGGPAFLDRLPRRVRMSFRTIMSPPPIDRIIHYVAKLHGRTVGEVLSRCREPTLVLARAQIAWYGVQHGGMTLSTAAKHLHRDASTLCRMINRHRHRYPNLFSREIFNAIRNATESST